VPLADAGEQDTQIVVNLGDGADGAARVLAGRLLLNADGGRQAAQKVNVGFLQLAQELTGGVSTLLEWDANIPEFPDLVAELKKAEIALQGIIPDTPLQHSEAAQIVSNPVDFQLISGQ